MSNLSQSSAKKYAVVVDGYRAGAFFAPRLIKRGYSCIHVKSTPNIAEFATRTFEPANYIENLTYDGHIDHLVDALKKYKIDFIVTGCDVSIKLVDALNEKLHLPSNGTKLSESRYNKFTMIETISKKGLKAAQQIKSDQVKEIIQWAEKLNQWPIVIKPLESAATDLVTFCHNEEEIRKAFENIQNTRNIYGLENKGAVAQSFLKGIEYVVNTVSLDGKHYVTDLWVYSKERANCISIIYDYIRILPYDCEQAQALIDYNFKVLDAIGIKYGAIHNEIMLTDEGPALVEVNARCMGGVMTPEIISESIGQNQYDLLLESYINPKQFLKIMKKPYTIKRHLMTKFLISKKSGTIRDLHHLEDIKQLRSFRDMKLAANIGGQIHKTIDLATSGGLIILSHPNLDVVMSDYGKIKSFEDKIFEVE